MPRNFDHLICVDESAIDRDEHIIATFEIETVSGTTLEEVGSVVAYDPTIGTWDRTAGETESVIERYSGKFLLPLPAEHQQAGQIRIAIPTANIDPIEGGLPQLLAVLGAPYTLKPIKHIRLVNLDLPRDFIARLPGPKFGVEGILKRFGSALKRPLIAMMLKPRTGLSTDEYAAMALEALRGGVDIIFDDELMVSPDSSKLLQRVDRMVAVTQQAKHDTGEPKRYAANITSSIRYAIDIAARVQTAGADFLYLNPITMGLPALEMLATSDVIRVPILCCRSGYGMWTRGQDGLSFFVLLKLARWAGADAMHIGSIGGSLPHALIGDDGELRSRVSWLRQRVKEVRRTLPILSGGLHPGNVGWNITRLGSEAILQAGSGVLAHPDGARAGGTAIRTAVEQAVLGVPAYEAARQNPSLKVALEKWGYLDGAGIHSLMDLWQDKQATGQDRIVIQTQGGAVVLGDVNVSGGKFVGRDETLPAANEE